MHPIRTRLRALLPSKPLPLFLLLLCAYGTPGWDFPVWLWIVAVVLALL